MSAGRNLLLARGLGGLQRRLGGQQNHASISRICRIGGACRLDYSGGLYADGRRDVSALSLIGGRYRTGPFRQFQFDRTRSFQSGELYHDASTARDTSAQGQSDVDRSVLVQQRLTALICQEASEIGTSGRFVGGTTARHAERRAGTRDG